MKREEPADRAASALGRNPTPAAASQGGNPHKTCLNAAPQ